MPMRHAVFFPLVFAMGLSAAADSEFSAGLSVRPATSMEQLGMPLYPGAVPHKEPGDAKADKSDQNSAGASINAWGGAFGLKVNAMKLRSTDSAEEVALWYRQALAARGKVLDCSEGAPADPPPPETEAEKERDKGVLRCGSDRAKPGGALFKQGRRSNVRVVAVEPIEGGTRISLVRVEVRGVD